MFFLFNIILSERIVNVDVFGTSVGLNTSIILENEGFPGESVLNIFIAFQPGSMFLVTKLRQLT